MIVRPATEEDAPALAAIYGHHVLHGFGTFEEVPPSAEEMARRRRAVVEAGLPYLVAEADGRVLGFAYAAPFRPRAAYRYTAEDSVYVRHDRRGEGLGRAVLAPVIEACRTMGLHQLIGVIGGSDNAASIGLHRSLGFEQLAVMPQLGFKAGKLVDVVWMQLELGPPRGEGLKLE